MSLLVSISTQQLYSLPCKTSLSEESLHVLTEFKTNGCLIKMLCGGEQEDKSMPYYRTERELDELIVIGNIRGSCTSLIKFGVVVEPYKSIGFILDTNKTKMLTFWDDWSFSRRFNDRHEQIEWNPSLQSYCAFNPTSEQFDIISEYNGDVIQAPPDYHESDIIIHSYRNFESFSDFTDYLTLKEYTFQRRNEVVVSYDESSIIGVVIDKGSWSANHLVLIEQLKVFQQMASDKLRQPLPRFLFDGENGQLEPF